MKIFLIIYKHEKKSLQRDGSIFGINKEKEEIKGAKMRNPSTWIFRNTIKNITEITKEEIGNTLFEICYMEKRGNGGDLMENLEIEMEVHSVML